MLKRIIIATFFVLTIPLHVHSAGENSVVISAFSLRTAEKSTDEFIQIMNKGEQAINLKGWRLVKKSETRTSYNLLTSFPDIFVEPKEGLVISHKDFSGESDLFYSTSTSSISLNNSIVLYSDAGSTIVDKVGWGTAKDFEGHPLYNPADGEIWTRRDINQDTNDNLKDFQKAELEGENTEVNSNPISIFLGINDPEIIITEIMPNPFGTDTGNEWVEIFNLGGETNLSGLSISDKMGSIETYDFGDLVIKAGQYFVFNLKTAGISLNNDGDILEIKNSQGEVICDSGESYGSAKEGVSYAFDGDGWLWTKNPTPGSTSVIEHIEEERKSTKSAKQKTTKSRITKAKLPKANVKGTTKSEDIFGNGDTVTESDKKTGMILIIIALVGGAIYAVYTNWSKLSELYIKERKRYLKFRKKFAKKIKKGTVLFLIGDLGSGKTQFVKGLVSGLGASEEVTSPTFVYENVYNCTGDKKFYHFDLYRENELDPDIREMIIEAAKDENGVVVIEWADRISEKFEFIPHFIKFKWLSENEREIEIE